MSVLDIIRAWKDIQRRALSLHCMEHSEDILHDCFLIGFKNVSTNHYREQGISLCANLVGIAKNLLQCFGVPAKYVSSTLHKLIPKRTLLL